MRILNIFRINLRTRLRRSILKIFNQQHVEESEDKTFQQIKQDVIRNSARSSGQWR
jgi:hypothetical protein